MDRKTLELKDLTKTGEISAKVATLGVIDREGDLAEPGFFGEQTVTILSSHRMDDLLLGKGTLSELRMDAIFEGRMNLDDPDAEKLHTKLVFDRSNPPPVVEWSYGYKILKGGTRRPDKSSDTEKGARRILQPKEDGTPGAMVKEVSPVLVGAGLGTGTIDLKNLDPDGIETLNLIEELAKAGDPEAVHLWKLHEDLDGKSADMKFVDEIAQTAVAVKDLLDRADAIADARRSGKLGSDAVARMTEMKSELTELVERIGAAVAVRPETGDLIGELLRYESIRSNSV